jgi:Protein of unknown function (DUF3558)
MSLRAISSPTASVLAVVAVSALVACGRSQEGKPGAASSADSSAARSNAAFLATPPESSPPSSSASVDPCALVTKAEAEAMFGVAMTGPEAKHADGSRTCTYQNASGNVLIIGVSDRPSSKATLEQISALMKAKSVSGVGDVAFEGPIGTISFVKGTTLYMIDAGISRWSDEKLLSLARTAASRL